MIGILDLHMGNLRSVSNAVYEVGYDFEMLDSPGDWDHLTHMILPGVGSFAMAMKMLHRQELVKPIRDFHSSGRPILGICLGMQLLVDVGTEGGECAGLGLVPGRVERLSSRSGFPVPHIGWNSLHMRVDHPVFRGLKQDKDFYFVHSYEVKCSEASDLLGVTDYAEPVTAVIGRDNVLGFQFHPEKSQVNGLRLMENFCDWDGQC